MSSISTIIELKMTTAHSTIFEAGAILLVYIVALSGMSGMQLVFVTIVQVWDLVWTP